MDFDHSLSGLEESVLDINNDRAPVAHYIDFQKLSKEIESKGDRMQTTHLPTLEDRTS